MVSLPPHFECGASTISPLAQEPNDYTLGLTPSGTSPLVKSLTELDGIADRDLFLVDGNQIFFLQFPK
jgi:hypothetical protein